jgi:ubiquinone/menaquinone biosynthesis C-methylase UbiE
MDFEKPDLMHLVFDTVFNSSIVSTIIPLYKRYVRSLGLVGTERVLEFGSGTGAASRHIAQVLSKGGGRLTCVDTSTALTEIATKRLRRYDNVELRVGDIRSLDIEDGIFDAVFVHFALHDVDKALRSDIVNALSGKLKSGGRLFIREPAKAGHGMPPAEIRDLMSEAGLTEIDSKSTKSLIVGPLYTGIYRKDAV